MDIFGVLTLVGGLAMFLYGMSAMGDGLTKMAGGKLEQILERLTSKKIFGVLLGAGVTAVIQSSSATTVMVVGFVNSGIMELERAVGIIMGANIGTTVTAWILSLAGIDGSVWWVKMLKPSSFSPILAAIGIVLIMTAGKSDKKKDIGNILVGFAILMFGMSTMSGAVEPLSDNPAFCSFLTKFSFPLLGMLAGTILTAIIQSSSASVGILQALCLTGSVTYATAIPVIMGQNIGTCVTSLISSIGANRNAKRAAMIHLYFNLIGTILFMVVFYSVNYFVDFSFLSQSASAVGIAIIHSTFNIVCTIVFYPFTDWFVKLARFTIKESDKEKAMAEMEEEEPVAYLDERFLERPAFAMEIAKNTTSKMAEEAKASIDIAFDLLEVYDDIKASAVKRYEDRVDDYDDIIGSYLVKLSASDLSRRDSETMSIILHAINDLERISDHALNVQELAEQIDDMSKHFSQSAIDDLRVLIKAVRDVVASAVFVFEEEDVERAAKVEPLEEVIDRLVREIKIRHIERLKRGDCTIELGIVFDNLLTDLERISDHCSNIAIAVIEIHEDEYDSHAYLNNLDKGAGSKYHEQVEYFENLYRLA